MTGFEVAVGLVPCGCWVKRIFHQKPISPEIIQAEVGRELKNSDARCPVCGTPVSTIHLMAWQDYVTERPGMQGKHDVTKPPEALTGVEECAGPVAIYSRNDPKRFSPDKTGCDHCQYVILGPTLEGILQAILVTPPLLASTRMEGNCLQCGKTLRGVMLCIDADEAKEVDISKWRLALTCPISLHTEGFRDRMRRITSPEDVAKGKTEVRWLACGKAG